MASGGKGVRGKKHLFISYFPSELKMMVHINRSPPQVENPSVTIKLFCCLCWTRERFCFAMIAPPGWKLYHSAQNGKLMGCGMRWYPGPAMPPPPIQMTLWSSLRKASWLPSSTWAPDVGTAVNEEEDDYQRLLLLFFCLPEGPVLTCLGHWFPSTFPACFDWQCPPSLPALGSPALSHSKATCGEVSMETGCHCE